MTLSIYLFFLAKLANLVIISVSVSFPFSRDVFLPKNTQEIEELLNSMQSRRFKLETYFDDLAMSRDDTGKDFPPIATALGSELGSGSGSKGHDLSSKGSESSSNKGKGKNKNKNKKGKSSRRK